MKHNLITKSTRIYDSGGTQAQEKLNSPPSPTLESQEQCIWGQRGTFPVFYCDKSIIYFMCK